MIDSDDWFRSWKHRREDEHIFHFNDQSLIDDNKNILTGIFKKKSNR